MFLHKTTFNYRITRWFSGNIPEISKKSPDPPPTTRPNPHTPRPPPGTSNPFPCFPHITPFSQDVQIFSYTEYLKMTKKLNTESKLSDIFGKWSTMESTETINLNLVPVNLMNILVRPVHPPVMCKENIYPRKKHTCPPRWEFSRVYSSGSGLYPLNSWISVIFNTVIGSETPILGSQLKGPKTRC